MDITQQSDTLSCPGEKLALVRQLSNMGFPRWAVRILSPSQNDTLERDMTQRLHIESAMNAKHVNPDLEYHTFYELIEDCSGIGVDVYHKGRVFFYAPGKCSSDEFHHTIQWINGVAGPGWDRVSVIDNRGLKFRKFIGTITVS